MGILPDACPDYIDPESWDKILEVGTETGHTLLHEIEIREAQLRAGDACAQIYEQLKFGQNPLDIVDEIGSKEAVERLIGPNWMAILTSRHSLNLHDTEHTEE